MIKRFGLLFAVIGGLAVIECADADSIFVRQNPRFAHLFEDNRARHVGDLITVQVRENTLFTSLERRELEKKTKANFLSRLTGATRGATAGDNFQSQLQGQHDSQRKLDGKANNQIDRRFTDRMSAVVIDVWPNGNVVIQGTRTRYIAREQRVILMRGVVRPADIGPNNTVESGFIANLEFSYRGRGQESDYQDNAWLGKIFNKIWPF